MRITKIGTDMKLPAKLSQAKSSQVYQLKVTLRGSKTPIWQRLLVSGSTSLAKLHGILLTTMGWQVRDVRRVLLRRFGTRLVKSGSVPDSPTGNRTNPGRGTPGGHKTRPYEN